MAIVGASDRPGSQGGRVVGYLRRFGYAGRILPVHPTARTVRGLPAYPTVSAAGGPVDLALLLAPAASCQAALDDCAEAGTRAVVVGAAGFSDVPGGAKLQARLLRRARDAGIRLLGPNCIGAANFRSGLVASFSPLFDAYDSLRPGGLAIVSHSGGLGYGLASLAVERGLRPGWVVNTGNEADVGAGEVMCALAEEPDCDGVIAYLESDLSPRWLRRLRESGKPVAALRAGFSKAGRGLTVTAAAATTSGSGLSPAPDVEELLDLAASFSAPPPSGDVVVVTTSGGAGVLAADAIERAGLKPASLSADTNTRLRELLPPHASIGNPLDVTASVISDPSLLTRALSAVVRDPGCGGVVVCLCVLGGEAADTVCDSLIEASRLGKPILVSRTGADALAPDFRPRLAEAGIGVYATPARAVAALAESVRPESSTRSSQWTR
ncbi:MAG: CoA-binding protein [Stackebrandtia sp.]